MVVFVSGSRTTEVGGLAGAVVVRFGSGEGKTVVGKFVGVLLVVGISAGETVVVMVVGTGSGST